MNFNFDDKNVNREALIPEILREISNQNFPRVVFLYPTITSSRMETLLESALLEVISPELRSVSTEVKAEVLSTIKPDLLVESALGGLATESTLTLRQRVRLQTNEQNLKNRANLYVLVAFVIFLIFSLTFLRWQQVLLLLPITLFGCFSALRVTNLWIGIGLSILSLSLLALL
ncbi:MAG: hypothetical protein NZO16_01135 [Deltaproteobacteria bacterium]|nr:hypothetical protein [Deltaproteobacteria bacterium]